MVWGGPEEVRNTEWRGAKGENWDSCNWDSCYINNNIQLKNKTSQTNFSFCF